MKRNVFTKKILPSIIAIMIFFSLCLPNLATYAENKDVDVAITSFKVTNSEEVIPPEGFVLYRMFKLHYTWDASNHGNKLRAGDSFEIDLPKQFIYPSEPHYRKFDVKSPKGEIVGKAVITPDNTNGGKIKVTFTDYVNDKYNVKGTMKLAARWNSVVYPVNEEKEYAISVGSFTEKLKLLPPKELELEKENLNKWAGQLLNNDGHVRWTVRINAKAASLSNVIIRDELRVEAPGNPEGIEYIENSFMLYEHVYEGGKYVEKNPRNVSGDIVFSPDKRSFTYDMGNLPGKGYVLRYHSTFKTGLVLKNKTTLSSTELQFKVYAHFVEVASMGTGQGDMTSKIKIIKVDEDDVAIKLKNAKFRITRKADGSFIDVVTDGNGEALSMPLIPGEYTIKEMSPPQGYLPNNVVHNVTVTSDKLAVKTIKNKPEYVEVKVAKEWQGKVAPKIKVELFADGVKKEEAELSTANSWRHTFKKLRKFAADGHEINYTVKEVGVSGNKIEIDGKQYTVTITPGADKNFKIVNKEEPQVPPTPPAGKKRDIKVVKEWRFSGGDTNTIDKIEVELYRDGVATGKKVVLNSSSDWKGEFKDLDVSSGPGAAKDYEYTVKEVGEDKGTVNLKGDWYRVTYGGNMQDGFRIINQKEVPPPYIPIVPKTPDTPDPPTPPVTPPPNKPEIPSTLDKPKDPPPTPPTPPTIPKKGKLLPKTGDGLDMSWYALMLLAAGSVFTFAGLWRRKKVK